MRTQVTLSAIRRVMPTAEVMCRRVGNVVRKNGFSSATLLSMLLTGCFGFRPFQPNHPEYQEWSKNGVRELDIKKAMLECGYPSPYEVSTSDGITVNDIALMHVCLTSNGFVYDKGRYVFCDHWRQLKACQSGSAVPARDVSKRISGRFCHAHSGDPVCH
jgi:hypothetical protein